MDDCNVADNMTHADCGKYRCDKCGFESWMLTEFAPIKMAEMLCLECAGFAPPTCGKHGDF